ncbi:hypothetical protein BS47DRAFT_1288344 [Hydnum rufescens UP504]|uniref:HTH CENPB-type domain-containing protein n=1 Tax=Hydnum rufescens UP504 TaxID=1448309 RepID=A0A9P6E1H6_9AGAM|nr:hypothetical protein BS47DRAFT_1288344 [Hydnum rufescens UP504]
MDVDSTTLGHPLNGKMSISQSNEAKSHLNQAESEVLIVFILKMADRGFPLTLQKIVADYALQVVQENSPGIQKLGINWAHWFVTKHSDHLASLWSSGLDTVWAAAINPENVKHYFDILGSVYAKYEPCLENIYGMDESGFPLGGSERECVIGHQGTKCQKKRCDGDKENVTVLATICTDGTSVPPAVIFKGQNFM